MAQGNGTVDAVMIGGNALIAAIQLAANLAALAGKTREEALRLMDAEIARVERKRAEWLPKPPPMDEE